MSFLEVFSLLLTTLAGIGIAGISLLLPGLHVTTVAALVLAVIAEIPDVSTEMILFLFIGLAVGYAMFHILPAIFLTVPDEGAILVVGPGQKYRSQSRACEAVILMGLGGLGGLLVLVVCALPIPLIFRYLYVTVRPHWHWMIWAIVVWMLLSEWPRGADRAPAGWGRWWEGNQNVVAGLISFLFAGILGFILLYRSPISFAAAYQRLFPAFAGLFAVPWLAQNIVTRTTLKPFQYVPKSVDVTPDLIVRGTLAGVLGGLFAAFFPLVTGGIGALVAGHATAQRDDRVFLICQGASRMAYIVGGLVLLLVPGLHLTRGGLAWLLSTRWAVALPRTYYLAVGAAAVAGGVTFLLLLVFTYWASQWISRLSYRWLSMGALSGLLITVVVVTGWAGLWVCVVASGIGLIPVLWGSRRVNLLGLLLLPIGLDLIGLADVLAHWLGLM